MNGKPSVSKEKFMFLNRPDDGRNNIVGKKVAQLRKAKKISQRQLSDDLGAIGLKIDKNAVQRIESGQRFVTDVELVKIAEVFNVSISEMYE